MRAGVTVRSCGTAAGRPLGHRVNDRERTSRPDGKARRDPARAAGSAGTGRAAGGAVPLSGRLAAPRTRLVVGSGAARVPPNQGVQPTPLARPSTWAVSTGKRAAASSTLAVQRVGKLSSAHVPVSPAHGGGSHVACVSACLHSSCSRRADAARLTPKRSAATPVSKNITFSTL